MARTTHRHRQAVSPGRIAILKVLGFRYSSSRDAYVLRLVGHRLGPVYQLHRSRDVTGETGRG